MRIDPSIPSFVVAKRVIRETFNTNRYWERTKGPQPEFRKHYERDKEVHLSFEPRGTRSQMVVYINSVNQPIALIHQYKRPDGTLGGSGKPDPKLLVHEGVLYIADPDDPED